MPDKKTIHVAIGFVTGRKSFQRVLKTYIYNWLECGLTARENVKLDLYVAYDLKYANTKPSDYTNVSRSLLTLIDDCCFIGVSEIQEEIKRLTKNDVLSSEEAEMLFGSGYSAKRNAVQYFALKNHADCLIFLDDDEYPVAVSNTHGTALWGGQHVLKTHLDHIRDADMTNGHHCGYISPIPYISFNDTLREADFRLFIEAISNDIINWDNIHKVMKNGGVTYADTNILSNQIVQEVQEVNHTKFISGANLCINLKDPMRVLPFYNPPGARGEDTFLSTCLHDRKVVRVPCYAFHDGFSTYNHLMDGVLPLKLKYIRADSERIVNRFYRACVGWTRYKPLLLYITQRGEYEEKIDMMRGRLAQALPKVSSYFNEPKFMNISSELERYHKNVQRHHAQFENTKRLWTDICRFLAGE